MVRGSRNSITPLAAFLIACSAIPCAHAIQQPVQPTTPPSTQSVSSPEGASAIVRRPQPTPRREDPPPSAPRCDGFSLTFSEDLANGRIAGILQGARFEHIDDRNAAYSCSRKLKEDFDRILAECRHRVPRSGAIPGRGGSLDHPWYIANCVAAAYISDIRRMGFAQQLDQRGAIPASPYVPARTWDAYCWLGRSGNVSLTHIFSGTEHDCTSGGGTYIHRSGVFHFNGACQNAPRPPHGNICASTASAGITPISLVWDDRAFDRRASTLRRFQINPHKGVEWLAWKGSAASPLLVQRADSGKPITSGAELFGSWTFGGRPDSKVSVSLSGDTSRSYQPWANGFEPLATLDRDHNGSVSGVELASLALWFDRDQDALEDVGEVVPLAEAGVTALRYGPTMKDRSSGDVTVRSGFDRVLPDGSRVRGDLFDWTTETAVNGADMLPESAAPTGTQKPRDESLKPTTTSARNSVAPDRSVAGAWRWSLVADENQTSGESPDEGRFLLYRDDQGLLRGHTIGWRRSSHNEADTTMAFVDLIGLEHQDNKGTAVQWRTTADGSDEYVNSSGQLSADGSTLRGKTEVRVHNRGRIEKVTYQWVAERM